MQATTTRRRLLELLRLAVLLMLGVALQSIFSSRVQILGVTADFFLTFTVFVGLAHGPVVGMVYGFASGLLADIVFLGPVGLRALILLLVGYVTGCCAERMPHRGAWAVVAITACASFLGQLIYGLFSFVTGTRAPFAAVIVEQLIPAALFNGLLAAPMQAVLIKTRLVPGLLGSSGTRAGEGA